MLALVETMKACLGFSTVETQTACDVFVPWFGTLEQAMGRGSLMTPKIKKVFESSQCTMFQPIFQ